MKKLFILGVFSLFTMTISHAQKASVEKSTYGIQTGYLGIWVYNEFKLSNQVAFRSELGLASGTFGSELGVAYGVFDSFSHSGEFIISPIITLEPRWYYNLNKRSSKMRDIGGNSGNFISLKANYNLNMFIIPIEQNLALSQFSIITNWGIKRNIGNHFNFETGIGFGYLLEDDRAIIDLHLRIGYRI